VVVPLPHAVAIPLKLHGQSLAIPLSGQFPACHLLLRLAVSTLGFGMLGLHLDLDLVRLGLGS
jgi:hypothetical protein